MLITPGEGVPRKVKVCIYPAVPSCWDEDIAEHEELGAHFEIARSVFSLDVLSMQFWAACP